MNIGDAAAHAYDVFKVGKGERPDLVRTGIPIIDSTVNGLFPGTLTVLGAEQGTGKSGVILSAILETPERAGAIFLEDGPDLVGGRALAYFSGVNSRKLRFSHRLTQGELKRVARAKDQLSTVEGVECVFLLGGSIDEIVNAVESMGRKGCRIIYLDYLQKVRGVNDNRRSEIGLVMTAFQRACRKANAVPVIATQLKRRSVTQDPKYAEPHLHDFKESGDIEGEARCAVLLWPDRDGVSVHARLAKSSFGGEGALTRYRRGPCGSLRAVKLRSEWSEVA